MRRRRPTCAGAEAEPWWCRFTAFLPGVMPGLAGASRMAHRRFPVFNVIGGVNWGGACVLLGFCAAHSIGTITHALGPTSGVVAAIIVVGLLCARRRARDA